MELIDYISGGITVTAVSALVIVITKFLQHLALKDDQFTTTINNHIQHDTEVKEKLIESNIKISESHIRLEGAINRLVDKL